MYCSTVTVAVANHRPCHANKDNLDRCREGDKVQQKDAGKGVGATDDRLVTEIRSESGEAKAQENPGAN